MEALETGKAERDQDHRISVQELYDYVYHCVTERSPAQTPHMKSELQGPLYVARSTYTAPARLHDDPLVEHPIAGGPPWGGAELAALLGSSDPATALAARQTLQRLVDDDSGRVARAAIAALADGGNPQPRRPVRRHLARSDEEP